MCLYLHLQDGEARGFFLDNANSYLNAEFQETQFKSLGTQLITLFLILSLSVFWELLSF